MIHRLVCGVLVVTFCACLTLAKDYYVAPTGSDKNAGTKSQPFATIQKAADVVQAGDRCFVLPGRYRETVELKNSGTAEKPIEFIALEPGKVILDGTDPIASGWEKYKSNIWRVRVDRPQIQQVFVDDVMQHEARWPDMPFEKRWDRKSWGKGGEQSEYGKVQATGLGETGVDWTGAIAMLNVGHQFFTWTRDVTSHEKGSDFFTYDRDLPGLAFLDPETGIEAQGGKVTPWVANQWKDDYFYLFGKLEGLTVPTEWFHDPEANWLYFMPQGDGPPQGLSIKARDFGLTGKKLQHLQFEGIRLHGCAFRFESCKYITLKNCHLNYPSYRRRVLASEQPQYKKTYPAALLSGSHSTIERCSIQHAGGTALAISGNHNTLDNLIIRDGSWSGTLWYSLIKFHGNNNVIRRCEIAQSGAPLIQHGGPNVIELSHIYNGGLLSEDVSAVYTSGEKARGAIVRYNWIHGVQTGHGLGQAIRGDDMTRGLIVHHNVVWDCGMVGIIVKGGENQIYNNTIFDVTNGKAMIRNRAGLIIPVQPEPRKPWKDYHKLNLYLDVQNSNSIIANNLVDDIYYRHRKIDTPVIQGNVEVQGRMRDFLVDPDNYDFRIKPAVLTQLPKPAVIPIDDGGQTTGNYIGAYAPDTKPWQAGPDWSLQP